MRAAKPNPEAGLARKWAAVGIDSVDWNVALAHYDAERLEEAYEAALDIGMGGAGHYLTWFRTIEAEYLTAQRSSLKQIQTFLEIETVSDDLEPDGSQSDVAAGGTLRNADWVATIALEAFHDVGARFGYRHESKVRLTVLAEETDAPWLHGRYGYCIAKVPFYKICVPRHLVGNRPLMLETLKHEYAHVVVGTLSQKRAPRWLEEAVAMLAEGGVSKDKARPFATGEWEWRNPADLEGDLSELGDTQDKWEAYVQSGLIGMFLSRNFGDDTIARLLRAFSHQSHWTELWSRLRGKYSDQSAVERTYRMSLDDLFKRTHEWIRAGR